jgi:urease accessory protein
VNDWVLWQLADSAFPAGGFVHSNGLEAAWQQGEIPDSSALSKWIEASLLQLCHGALPFMTAALASPERFAEFDHLCDAFLLNHVANRASRAQGKALLASSRKIFGGLSASRFSSAYCHYAPVFGLVANELGLNSQCACRLSVFMHVRGIFAAAVRLGIVGPMEAHALQYRLRPLMEARAEQAVSLGLDEIAQTSPLLEIWQGTHDRLYSRLFQS